MSKMDNLRAMREAKYAESQKRASATPAKAAARPRVAPSSPAASTQPEPAAAAAPDTDELCGHRNMSGRTCTRERGHAAKSHRYS
jgi:hypothetical protein